MFLGSPRGGELYLLLGVAFLSMPMEAQAEVLSSTIKPDEHVVFFPTVAHLNNDGDSWFVPIHGWIFEPEEDDWLRSRTVRELRDLLELPSEHPQTGIFERRVRAFLVDNERGKSIGVRIAGRDVVLPESAANGHFTGVVQLPASAIRKHQLPWLEFHAMTAPDDQRKFVGEVQFVAPEGISVISDIDDTIKHTHVRDKREMLRNTFFQEFRAVDGMAACYQRWDEAGATFHYVSSSPWQLYEPLMEFMLAAGYPRGSFHLRPFRLKDSSVPGLLDTGLEHKTSMIEKLLQDFPRRKFLLVGDSAEKDPEIYGSIARRYRGQVVRIYVRDVTGESADSQRYEEALRGVPEANWQLFADAESLSLPRKSEQ